MLCIVNFMNKEDHCALKCFFSAYCYSLFLKKKKNEIGLNHNKLKEKVKGIVAQVMSTGKLLQHFSVWIIDLIADQNNEDLCDLGDNKDL